MPANDPNEPEPVECPLCGSDMEAEDWTLTCLNPECGNIMDTEPEY